MAKIKVYRKDNGAIVRIPEHWVDIPALWEPFRKTPSQKTKDLEKEARAEQEAAKAALANVHQTPASSAAEPANHKPNESAHAGDDKKE